MTETATNKNEAALQRDKKAQQVARGRKRAEARFKLYGILAVSAALLCLAVLLSGLIAKGYSAIHQSEIRLEISFDAEVIDPKGSRAEEDLSRADYQSLVKNALRALFPDVKKRKEKKQLYNLASSAAGLELREMVLADPDLIGSSRKVWLTASDDVDVYRKGLVDAAAIGQPKLADWVGELEEKGLMESRFNSNFFTSGDSREPEQAGILGALMGSFYTLLVCFLVSFPIGVLAAVYLEEFAPRNRLSDLIEININNLAAVPSIVFGLLGLTVLLNFIGLPRSAPIAGGLVLALMTFPTIIIATRAALKSVPPSIREAAYGLGASPMQVTFHHVVPLALPGILTGSIIGMAQALGETAPLLLIGMVAFIVDIPGGFLDSATTLPVQIYIWADSPERAFTERTAAAILVLLGFLLTMNLTAVVLRRKFEIKW